MPRDNRRTEILANSLGWFSIGLGVAEMIAPRQMGRLIGLHNPDRRTGMLRSYGIREVAAGVGILSGRGRAGWMWGRVAGDLVDLTSLGAAFASRGADRPKVAAATAAVLGVTALDVLCSQKLTNGGRRSVRLRKTIVIDRDPSEVYAFWRDFNNLRRIVPLFESVEAQSMSRSHWKMKLPAGKTLEWDAEIHQDIPGSSISWQAVQPTALEHSGWVRFDRAPGGRGTLVTLSLEIVPPASAITAPLLKALGPAPKVALEASLMRLKQLLETGEIARSDASLYLGPHAAQPPEQVPELAFSHS